MKRKRLSISQVTHRRALLWTRADVLSVFAIALVCAAVYAQTWGYDFVHLDDPRLVTRNPMVNGGFSWEGLRWSFTMQQDPNFMPLTWMSHMLDCQLFGVRPGLHHLMNVVYHTASSILLFLVLLYMTGARGPSLFTAAVFAVHPLHVESVAWISERKDVLCGLFWILTMGAHARHARGPCGRSYLIVLLSFALALASKPMAVTLPFVLLLLDVWPLQRALRQDGALDYARFPRLVLEKAPMFVAVAVVAGVTARMQSAAGAMPGEELLPLSARLQNVPVAYIVYLYKTFLPWPIAVFYPHARSWPLILVALCTLLLLVITAAAAWGGRRRPYLWTGWFWFLGTLVPVIGVVQVGHQAWADRYSYLPMVGLLLAVSWGVSDLLRAFPRAKRAMVAMAAVAVVCLAASAHVHVRYWKDTETIARRALAVTKDNWSAHHGLGNALVAQGRYAEAAAEFDAVVRLMPDFPDGLRGQAFTALMTDQPTLAEARYRKFLERYPRDVNALDNLGLSLLHQGKIAEAKEAYRRAFESDPKDLNANVHLAQFAQEEKDFTRAEQHAIAALSVQPNHPAALVTLGEVKFAQGRFDQAFDCFTRALQVAPQHSMARTYLGVLLGRQGKLSEACTELERAVKADPTNAFAHYNLGVAKLELKRPEEARSHFSEALRLAPDYTDARKMLSQLDSY